MASARAPRRVTSTFSQRSCYQLDDASGRLSGGPPKLIGRARRSGRLRKQTERRAPSGSTIAAARAIARVAIVTQRAARTRVSV